MYDVNLFVDKISSASIHDCGIIDILQIPQNFECTDMIEFPVCGLCSLVYSFKVEPILVQPTYCTELHKTSGLECIS